MVTGSELVATIRISYCNFIVYQYTRGSNPDYYIFIKICPGGEFKIVPKSMNSKRFDDASSLISRDCYYTILKKIASPAGTMDAKYSRVGLPIPADDVGKKRIRQATQPYDQYRHTGDPTAIGSRIPWLLMFSCTIPRDPTTDPRIPEGSPRSYLLSGISIPLFPWVFGSKHPPRRADPSSRQMLCWHIR